MIGIGVDLVEVDRVRRVLDRTPSLVTRLFTEAERAYAESAADPAERLRAALRRGEAAMKALLIGPGAVDWHDLEVARTPSGAPDLVVTGRAAELAATAGVTRWLLTMTHTATMAEAVVVAL